MGRRAKSRKIGKVDLRRAIHENGGNLKRVSDQFNVSRQTVYNSVEHYDLWADVDTFRQQTFRMAEGNIFDAVQDGDMDASKFVVTHMPGGPRWSSRQEVSVDAIHLDENTLKLLEELGLPLSEVAGVFNQLIAEEAEKMAAEVDNA